VVEDLSLLGEFAESAEFLRAYGVVAAQSTPLHSEGGKLLGMLSTHFATPHRPSERELRLLDLYVQQAERVIERRQAMQSLRKSEERLALALQAAVLLRAGNPLADAFCRSRLGGGHGLAFGTLPADARLDAAVERVIPSA